MFLPARVYSARQGSLLWRSQKQLVAPVKAGRCCTGGHLLLGRSLLQHEGPALGRTVDDFSHLTSSRINSLLNLLNQRLDVRDKMEGIEKCLDSFHF